MKALIIDDVSVFQRYLLRHLGKYGKSDSAQNAKEGLDLYIKAQKKQDPYDLIFLDIMMPGLNGIELLRKIRSVDTGPDHVQIIMGTASADKKSVEDAKKYGCDGYLIKPFSIYDLDEQLLKLGLIDKT